MVFVLSPGVYCQEYNCPLIVILSVSTGRDLSLRLRVTLGSVVRDRVTLGNIVRDRGDETLRCGSG
jgi:hypothetical protein